jgi:CubicO group peptidase (beta-lactamase class C family)
LIWQHYAGVADTETHARITADSLFPGCSLGKPVFAYAVLRMAQTGKFDLDRPLKGYLTRDAPTGAFGELVTARHVLSHSSGFVNWRQSPEEPLASNFTPGTRFQYSGEGFYTLQRCVEKITGIGFEAFMQQQMMQPLSMRSSTYLWCKDAANRVVSGHANGQPVKRWDFAMQLFELIEASGEPMAAWHHERIAAAMGKKLGSPPMPNSISPNVAFSLLTTVPDYAAFVARLMAPGKEPFDITPPLRNEMMRPHSRINSALSWGLGWGIQQEAASEYLWCWGDNGFWKNFVLVHPESQSAIVVFTNGTNGMRVAERIVRAASGRDHAAFMWV